MRDRGMEPYDIIYTFKPDGSINNDNLLIDLLENE